MRWLTMMLLSKSFMEVMVVFCFRCIIVVMFFFVISRWILLRAFFLFVSYSEFLFGGYKVEEIGSELLVRVFVLVWESGNKRLFFFFEN